MAAASVLLSYILLPPQQIPLTKRRSSTCMAQFSTLDSISNSPFKIHCFACKETVENQDFHQHHILDQAVIFYDENNIKEHICILRNCLTCGK